MKGYKAETLPGLCEAYLKARDVPGTLQPSQLKIAAVAESLIRVFAKVGIVAWIHEVTGYQYVRSPNALSVMVALYIDDERRKWQKEFRNEFYTLILRMYGKTQQVGKNRPRLCAAFTSRYIYEPMERGAVLKELDRLNPIKNGNRKDRLHQHLSKEYGLRRLHERIEGTITCLKLAGGVKKKFESLYGKAFPGDGGHQEDLFDDLEDDAEAE